MTKATTYCRIFPAACGLVLDLDDGRVVKISGDQDHRLTRGFTCVKGRYLADFVTDPARLLSSQRRVSLGAHEDVGMWGSTLVSMQGGYFTGFPIHDGMRRLLEEKRPLGWPTT